MKFFQTCIFCISFAVFFPLAAEVRLGSDKAAPEIAQFLGKLPLVQGTVYTFSDQETLEIIALSAKIGINVFELIDCTYRYTAPRRMRIAMTGDSLRKAESKYNLGGERIAALLPVEIMIRMETGAVFAPGQNALDVYLTDSRSTYIEIGTAVYEKKFGFTHIEPLLFSNSYGITVKKLFFSAPLEKLELYEPSKGAIYAKGVSKPKRWVLRTITAN